jgi:hypothetical protein
MVRHLGQLKLTNGRAPGPRPGRQPDILAKSSFFGNKARYCITGPPFRDKNFLPFTSTGPTGGTVKSG